MDYGNYTCIQNCSYISNKASYGGVFRLELWSSLTIHNSLFRANNASEGGTIDISKSSRVSIYNSNFTQNYAQIAAILIADVSDDPNFF